MQKFPMEIPNQLIMREVLDSLFKIQQDTNWSF